jgi:hypothetical protein
MPLLDSLRGGDRRMVRGVDDAIAAVEQDPALIVQLIAGMQSDDPLIRMRSADAAEKLTATHPDWLQLHKRVLLNQIAKSEQQEVRWHVAQMLPRLRLTPTERRRAVSLMLGYLDDKSKIVRTFAMQALSDLAMQDQTLVPQVMGVIESQMADGSPAMRARGKKLLAQLAQISDATQSS